MAKTERGDGFIETKSANWKLRGILVGIAVLAALFVWWIGGAVIPRWWAQRIGGIVDGRLVFGSFLGIGVGFVAMLVPILILRIGWRLRARLARLVGFAVVALLTATPNLATLGIVRGDGNAAHAGERILDVDGPGFRGGTVVGVIAALALAAVVGFLLRSRRANKAKTGRLERELEHTRRVD